MSDNIWKILTHETIISIVEKTLIRPLGNLCLRRNSYVNRVYELETLDTKERYIVKFYRPGRWTEAMIREEHRFVQQLSAEDIPVIPPLVINNETLFMYENIFFTVYPKKGGRAIDEFDKPTWQNIGRILAKMHIVGERHASSERIVWRPNQVTENHATMLYPLVPVTHQASFMRVVKELITMTEDAFAAEQLFVIHGDCHRGNFIHRPGEGIYIVDFDDMCVGPAVQDLWMLLPGTPEECEQELAWFFEGYETFREFPRDSLNLIPALRAMRLIHFSAWCALQRDDLDFADHFPEWGTTQYWGQLIRDVQETLTHS